MDVVGILLEAQPLMALFLTFGEVIRALPADGNTLGGSHGTPPPSCGSRVRLRGPCHSNN